MLVCLKFLSRKKLDLDKLNHCANKGEFRTSVLLNQSRFFFLLKPHETLH